MAFKKVFHKAMLLALSVILLSNFINSEKVIAGEILSDDRLQNRVKVFNEWYSKLNPTAKVEAKLSQDNKIHLYAKADLKAEDTYLTVNRNLTINPQSIYETKIGTFVKSLEEQYGFDDYLNMAFYILHEISNPESKWKPYLDILPRQPNSLAFDYWKRKTPIEEEFINTPILSIKFYQF